MSHFAELGSNIVIQEPVIIGLRYSENCRPTTVGDNAIIRANTIVYADVVIGNGLRTGHNVVIREHTNIGNTIVVGTGSIIEGHTQIGNCVKLESLVYVPTHTRIGNYVFIGPGATLTNDRYPQRQRDSYIAKGPIIEDGVTIGANCIVLPGVTVGKGSFIAAGSVVTKDIPPWTLVKGVPGRHYELPAKLKEINRALKW